MARALAKAIRRALEREEAETETEALSVMDPRPAQAPADADRTLRQCWGVA
jgi:hypothetical protein